jgi:putative FmdB family regulatory protein
MPIYEYECKRCGEHFDKLFRSLNQIPAEINCPACHSLEVQRLMSVPAIHTTGRGGAEAGVEESAPAKTPFGRKELNQAMEQKRQQREEVKYEMQQAKKKPPK